MLELDRQESLWRSKGSFDKELNTNIHNRITDNHDHQMNVN